jgi:hypothetical protein
MAVYATIGLYDSRELADALATRQKDVEALISGVTGLRSYHLIRTENGCASITVCDGVAGTEESTRIAAEWIRDNLPDIRIGQPEIRSGEVLVRTGSEVPALETPGGLRRPTERSPAGVGDPGERRRSLTPANRTGSLIARVSAPGSTG